MIMVKNKRKYCNKILWNSVILIAMVFVSCSSSNNLKIENPSFKLFEICYLANNDYSLAIRIDSNGNVIKSAFKDRVYYGQVPDSIIVRLNSILKFLANDTTLLSERRDLAAGPHLACITVYENDTILIEQINSFQPRVMELLQEVQSWDLIFDSTDTNTPFDWQTWQLVMPPPPPPLGIKQIVFKDIKND
jgi:hypothetical protein